MTTDLLPDERRLDRALGRIALPAHQFDEDVDLRIGRERHRIGDPARLRTAEVTRPCGVAGADRDHVDRAAATLRQHVAVLGKQPHHGGTDRAEPG